MDEANERREGVKMNIEVAIPLAYWSIALILSLFFGISAGYDVGIFVLFVFCVVAEVVTWIYTR